MSVEAKKAAEVEQKKKQKLDHGGFYLQWKQDNKLDGV